MRRHSLYAAVAAAIAFTSPSAAQFSCFEPSLGSSLALGDEAVAGAVLLGFTFPGPGGVAVTDVDMSSNGFVYLGRNGDPGCCSGFEFLLLPGPPRIAPYWANLDPAATPTSGVFFNAFAATATSPARAVVTWLDVREGIFESPPFTVQFQLRHHVPRRHLVQRHVGRRARRRWSIVRVPAVRQRLPRIPRTARSS
jgi:hypothetical protein